MKKVTIISAALSMLALVGCKNDNPKPKVIYRDKPVAAQPKKIDSSQIKVADLPILMEGTKYLIYPIGDLRIYETGHDATDSRAAVSYAISNYSRNEITGYFDNLKFQHADSTALRPLTDKKVQIQTVTYLNTVAERTKKQILVYSLMDGDTNQDGKVDGNDIKAFYISNINGSGFKKLSGETQELVDWNVIETQNRVYFRTLEDINKNGAFDKNDTMHYHYVDLLSAGWEVSDYEPVK